MANIHYTYAIQTTDGYWHTFIRLEEGVPAPTVKAGDWYKVDDRVGQVRVTARINPASGLDEYDIELETRDFVSGAGLDNLIEHLTTTGWGEEKYNY